MEAGSRDAALEILSRPPVGAAHPYITALASYDVENFADSDAYWDLMPSDFKMMPEALALRADSFLRQRRYAESENFHEILLQNYPRYSALPYRNSVFFQHRRKPWSGFSFLQRSLPIFPENYSLALDYAKSLAALGRREESRAEGEKIFAAFSARADEVSREDTLAAEDTRVLALVTEREDIPLARFVGGLWFLRNDYPDNPSIPALLRPHLLSQHDYTALRTLLTETEADSHSLSYLAGLSIVEKDLPAARELLRRQTEKFPLCPEGFYNLGLVEQELAQGEAALAAFRTAEECALYADSPGFEEKNFLKITEALISLNRLPEAHSLLMEFLDAHPENPAALHNLRKLEAKTK
jgi:tetratricopeptide (TPR) repeat protein